MHGTFPKDITGIKIWFKVRLGKLTEAMDLSEGLCSTHRSLLHEYAQGADKKQQQTKHLQTGRVWTTEIFQKNILFR